MNPELALEQARAAAAAARQAADAAQANADAVAAMLGSAAHTASGGAIDPFVFRFAIFVLAVFVGYYVVWSVTPALHTPLMSVTNAISSVIVVGALLAVTVGAGTAVAAGTGAARWLGFLALILAAVNIFGGFLVTQRMLGMYRRKEPRAGGARAKS
jgi:NAD(P) transhydrogenase subunit alpha